MDDEKEEIKEETDEVVSEVINEKIKNSVQSFIDSLTGQSELRPDKLGDCFKKAIGCSEFDEKVQSGMKKVIELHYNSSREMYEKQFKVDMEIILELDLSLNSNYSKEDLMALLPNPVVVPEPVVVQGTVVVQEPVVVKGTIVGSDTKQVAVQGTGTNEPSKPQVNTQENKSQIFENLEEGAPVSAELYNQLTDEQKKM
jgi:hypothetical protein